MAFLKANRRVPEMGVVPWQLLRQGPWGEIWRANRDGGPTVLLVVYSTTDGETMFDEARPMLELWKKQAPLSCPHLLKIIEIGDRGVPYLLVEDPAGPCLREFVESLKEPMPLDRQGALAEAVARGLQEAEAFALSPVGITPDTIFRATHDAARPWKLLPVGPASRTAIRRLGYGRYFPPGLEKASEPRLHHPDTFALACILIEVFRRDFEAPWGAVKDTITVSGYRGVIDRGLLAPRGIHEPAGGMVEKIHHWRTTDLATDAERLANPNPPAPPGRKLWIAAVLMIVAGLGGVAGFLYYEDQPKAAVRPGAEAIAVQFMEAIVRGDTVAGASLLASGEEARVETLIGYMRELADAPNGTVFVRAARAMRAEPPLFEFTVVDRVGGDAAVILVSTTQADGANWRVKRVDYRRNFRTR